MKNLSILILVLLMTAIVSGCIAKAEAKFKEGDFIKLSIPTTVAGGTVLPRFETYKEVKSYDSDTDKYILSNPKTGKESAYRRETVENKWNAVLVEIVPVEVPEDPENIENLFP